MPDSKQLIVQFKIAGDGNQQDLATLVRIEEELDSAFQQGGVGEVDGHDIGNGEMNIFVVVSDWEQSVTFLKNYLKTAPWAAGAVAAKRQFGEEYEVIFPENHRGQFRIT